jgi:hypothetical protein
MARFDLPTLVGGILLLCTGLAFGFFSLRMPLGTANHMGPGYFPLLVSVVLCVLSVGTIALSLRRSVSIEAPAMRPLFWVIASTVVFVTTTRTLGVVPAVFLTVVMASVADKDARPLHAALLALGASLVSWLVFIVVLRLPLTAFRMPL